MKIAHIVMGLVVVGAALGPIGQASAQDAAWKPAGEHLKTRWAKEVKPEAPLPEYPRPTLVREKWANLNGLWNYRVQGGPEAKAVSEGKILVPFPIESSLSGVARRLKNSETLICSRSFTVPAEWTGGGQRIMLHFGAVNWEAEVSVNGKRVGAHIGGYDPFSFDITDALRPGENKLEVVSKNPGNSGGQPRGKQFDRSHSIWYESSSGIWQTVWMEPVPKQSIARISVKADRLTGEVVIDVVDSERPAMGSLQYVVEIFRAGKSLDETRSRGPQVLPHVPKPDAWSPSSPALYALTVRTESNTGVVDEVKSYFAFRDIAIGKDDKGINRLMLNGKPVFQYGPLDQGYWPDGLYTAPTDAALKFDVEAVKLMGGNMLRKHVKVEPERFYYWCDTLGILVWQDMPSPFFKTKEFDEGFPEFDQKWAANFEREWKAIMAARHGHPSIVMWVPFNEGWGQNDQNWARSMALRTKEWDPTRLVNNASGWHDMKVGDVNDIHRYPDPATPPVEEYLGGRAAVLGEFGGLGLPLDGHTWVSKDNWGYRSYKTKEEVTAAYCVQMEQIPALIAQGLCAAVYTQTTDVEIECNGWLTYDREVWKIDPDRAREATLPMYLSPPEVRTVLAHAGTNGDAPRPWKYTMSTPGADWMKVDAAMAGWKEGAAGFGSKGTPGAAIGTEWTTPDIWVRTEFTLDSGTVPTRPYLHIHHDEDAQVFINGTLAATLKGFTSDYKLVRLSKDAAGLLQAGKNTIAIHCRQTTGGQYVDCGIVEIGAGK